jgi:hypothetical protein
MFALIAIRSVSREPFMGTTDRWEESDPNLRFAPQPAAPGPLAERAALAPSSPEAEAWAQREGPWSRFLTALLRALSAWHT